MDYFGKWEIGAQTFGGDGNVKAFRARLRQPTGRIVLRALVKWDGCVDLHFAGNLPFPEDDDKGGDEEDGNAHFCGMRDPLLALFELFRLGTNKFASDDAWKRPSNPRLLELAMSLSSERAAKFPILKQFAFAHLPVELQKVSLPFHDLAYLMVTELGGTGEPAELAAGLRKLLEAKDCCVRAART